MKGPSGGSPPVPAVAEEPASKNRSVGKRAGRAVESATTVVLIMLGGMLAIGLCYAAIWFFWSLATGKFR